MILESHQRYLGLQLHPRTRSDPPSRLPNLRPRGIPEILTEDLMLIDGECYRRDEQLEAGFVNWAWKLVGR